MIQSARIRVGVLMILVINALVCVGLSFRLETETSSSTCNCPNQSNNQGSRLWESLPLECGQSKYTRVHTGKRIAGGRPAEWGEFPSAGFLLFDNEFSCGAMIISELHLIATAHCVAKEPSRYLAIMGRLDRNKSEKDEHISRLEKICRHSNYTKTHIASYNDVAIMKLVNPIRFDDRMQPVCLAEYEALPGEHLRTTGYGNQEGEVKATILKVLQTRHARCLEDVYHPSRFCMRTTEAMGTTCLGDSGGGSYTIRNGKQYLLGVNSFSHDPCRNDKRYLFGGSGIYELKDEIHNLLKRCQ